MLLRAVATVGGFTMASRLLGFVRDLLIAAILGAGPVADAFFVALRLPNLFRRLFAEGAFNAAFVPVFAGVLARDGPAAARGFAERMLALMAVTLTLITIAAELAMPALVYGLAPGLADKPGNFALAVEMARLTFPYLWFIALASLMGAVLNALDKFAAAAAAPCVLNLVMIAALVFAADALQTPGHVLSVAVALAGLAQLVLMAWAMRRAGFALRLVPVRLDPVVRRTLRLLGPGAVGAGALQLNMLVNTLIASLLPVGAISYLYYADRIYQLPLGVIGIGIGTALLPSLSRALKGETAAAANAALNRALELSLFLTLPAAVALAVIPEAIVRVLFQRGAFAATDTVATAWVLAAYAVGLPAFVLVKVLSPGFFAREDTATPVKIATASIALNIALGFALYRPLGVVGLAVATTVASWANALALGWLLHRRGDWVADRGLARRAPRVLAASLAMGGLVLAGAEALAPPLHDGE
ncbi:MAG: murein biosynthesis integral membrane protein MurJ, partial [Alphaproteobacteria bacterium]|nr:murein biosynthesis integral membrane protein MurJ [Alphaproteobacteria bacterium]